MAGRVLFLLLGLLLSASVGVCFAEYTPLIDSGFLDGPKGDIQTLATGLLTIVAILAGVGLLIRALLK